MPHDRFKTLLPMNSFEKEAPHFHHVAFPNPWPQPAMTITRNQCVFVEFVRYDWETVSIGAVFFEIERRQYVASERNFFAPWKLDLHGVFLMLFLFMPSFAVLRERYQRVGSIKYSNFEMSIMHLNWNVCVRCFWFGKPRSSHDPRSHHRYEYYTL